MVTFVVPDKVGANPTPGAGIEITAAGGVEGVAAVGDFITLGCAALAARQRHKLRKNAPIEKQIIFFIFCPPYWDLTPLFHSFARTASF